MGEVGTMTREENLDYCQSRMIDISMDLAWLGAELGNASEREGSQRRLRLQIRLEQRREQINSLARRMVELMGPEETGPVHESEILDIRNVVGEPLAMYFVDSNIDIGFLIFAPTAETARAAVKRIVDRSRDGDANHGPKIRRLLKPFVNGKKVVINNVYFVCNLREALFGEKGDG